MKKIALTLILILLGSSCLGQVWGPADLSIEGPKEGDAGEEMVVEVQGLPTVNLDEPLGKSLEFMKDLVFLIDAPNEEEIQTQTKLELIYTPAGVSFAMKVSFVPESEGIYLIIVDWNAEPFGIAKHRVLIGDQGPPPPDPDDPDPPHPPTENPFPSEGFAVMIVREAKADSALTVPQRAIFTNAELHRFILGNVISVDGDPFYRIWDDDFSDDDLEEIPDHLVEAYKTVRDDPDRNSNEPWIGIATADGKGFLGPLPLNTEATLDLLKKVKEGRRS